LASTGHLTTLAYAHKYWWISSYNNGNPRVFFDDRGFDKSVDGYVLGVVVPIFHEQQFLGIIKSNVYLEKPLKNILLSQNKLHKTQMTIARTGGLIVLDEKHEPLSEKIDSHFKGSMRVL